MPILSMMDYPYGSSKMVPRPPFLSAFDYIFYLKRQLEKERTDYDSGDDCKEYVDPLIGLSIETPNLSDLLKKLAEDLKMTRGSFVDDFINEPQNGVSWILDLLRSSLNRQQCPGMVISSNRDQPSKSKMIRNKERQYHLKRAMKQFTPYIMINDDLDRLLLTDLSLCFALILQTDEYDCLLCLKHVTTSSQKALHKILSHRNGLLSLASCIVSNLIKSRIIAVELLTKICDIEPDGARKVLEAMSTMRIIFGESVRFKLLISILNSSSGVVTGFEAAVLTFLNSLLDKSMSDAAERIRLQNELEEAGLNVNLIEKKAKEKSLSSEDPIWTEIRIWNERYIDVNECLKKKRALTRETTLLKEKVDSLSRNVRKLEEDKKKLMVIERELKDKVESLERELIHCKARLCNDAGVKGDCRRRNKQSGRPGSDNSDPLSCAVDSGRWSDSEGQIGNDPGQSSGSDGKRDGKESPIYQSSNEDATDDQNVRNEDIFIYIPSIMPPANFNNYVESGSRAYKQSSEEARKSRKPNQSGNEGGPWRATRSARKNDQGDEARPQIVEVYPKPKEDLISCSTSVVGADCEDTELMLDWQYPKIKKTESLHSGSYVQKSSEKSFKSNSKVIDSHPGHYYKEHSRSDQTKRQRSHSTGHLVDHDDTVDAIKSTENWTQFLLKTKGSSMASLNELTVEDSVKANKRGEKKSFAGDSVRHVTTKSKSFASSLQSYLFSGGSHKQKSETNSLKGSCDSSKSFPLPNVYKKNFIAKGHGNCGRYSDEGQKTKTSKLPELSSSSVSKMLHREIALAAKEVGAFY